MTIAELKSLRCQINRTLKQIDAVLIQCGGWDAPVTHTRTLIVEGRCKEISSHALERYRERSGSIKSDDTVIRLLTERIGKAKEMELLPKFKLIEMLAHGTNTRYFRCQDGMMAVVENDIIVTIHKGEAKRWKEKTT